MCPEADLFHSTQHNPRDSWAISCTSNIHQHGPFWCTGMWDRKMVRGFSPCCQLPPHSHINQVNFSWKSRGGKPCHLALSSVQLLSHVRIFATPRNAACQASLSFTNSWNFLKLHEVSDAIHPSYPLLSPSPPAFNLSSIRGFSNDLVLRIRWPSIGPSASASVLPMNIQD